MLKEDLKQFYGTEHYYRITDDVMITDGVKYFADKTEAFELILDIAVNKVTKKELKNEELIVIKTHKDKNNKIKADYEDGNGNKLFKYTYQNLKLPDDGEYTLWMETNVILLPNEH